MSSSVCNYWGGKELNVNTDLAVIVWMICVIPQIRENLIDNSDGDYSK